MAKRLSAKSSRKSLDDILGADLISPDVEYHLETGMTLLDIAASNSLEHRGFPGGRIIGVSGPPLAGKTVLFYHLMESALQQGGEAIYIDVEGRHSMRLASLVSSTCLTGMRRVRTRGLEHTLKQLEAIIEQFLEVFADSNGKCPPYIVCIDSVAQLGAESEMEAGEVRPLAMSQLWAYFLRSKWPREIVNKPFYLLLSNQPKEDLNFQSYGPKKTREPGGKGLKHAYSLSISASSSNLFQIESEKKHAVAGVEEGKDLTYKIEKNCEGFPGVTLTIPFFYRYGVCNYRAGMNFLCGNAYQQLRGSAWTREGNMWVWARTGDKKARASWDGFFTRPENSSHLKNFLSDVENEFLAFLRLES